MSNEQKHFISKADLQLLAVDQFLDIDLDSVQLLSPKKVLPAGKYAFVAGDCEVIEMGEDKNSGVKFPFNLTSVIELDKSGDSLPEDIEWPIEVGVNCQLENDKDGSGKRRLRTITEGFGQRLGLKTGGERMAAFSGMTGVLELRVDSYKRDNGTVQEYNSVNIFTLIYN